MQPLIKSHFKRKASKTEENIPLYLLSVFPYDYSDYTDSVYTGTEEASKRWKGGINKLLKS